MKFLGVLQVLILLGILFAFGIGASQAMDNPDMGDDSSLGERWSGMPPRSIPEKPIPHHDPGHPSRAGDYSTQVTRINAEGIAETTTLTGLDAMLADGVIDDPLQGNYRLVDLDKIMMGFEWLGDPGIYDSIWSFSAISGTISSPVEVISGSTTYSTDEIIGITAGDLNADGLDEQISAWMDSGANVYLSAGEMPGSVGKATSDPAAVAHNDGSLDLLVRGYDQTLWHRYYNGTAWEDWNNDAAGVLLSAPAIASQGDGSFDAFAIGLDNMIYHRGWDGTQWSPDWELVDDPGFWIQASEMPTRTMVLSEDVDAPAAVARNPDLIDLFRRGPDNRLYWRHFNGTYWEDWVSLDNIITSGPSAVSQGADHIQVFANGVDGMVWHRTYTGGNWGRWARLAMPGDIRAASAPTAIYNPGANSTNVFLRGTDDALWMVEYDGNAWGVWETLGGELASGAGVAARGDMIDLFALQDFGHFLHNHFNGTSWSGWGDWDALDTYQQISTAGINTPDHLDLTTGHFSGDGRSQVAMSYVLMDTIYIKIFDALVGFELQERAAISSSDPFDDLNYGKLLSIVAGDFNGDGTDEIATIHLLDTGYQTFPYRVRLYDVIIDTDGGWAIEEKGEETITITLPGSIWGLFEFEITAGDFDADGEEELAAAILTCTFWSSGGYNYNDIYITIQSFDIPSLMDINGMDEYTELLSSQDNLIFDIPGGVEIEAGNIDGLFFHQLGVYNGDEIVVTLAEHVDETTIDNRTIIAYGFTGSLDFEELARLDLPCPLCEAWEESDALALGDFNRDLKDEIAFLYPSDNMKQNLDVYGYWFDPEQPEIDPYLSPMGKYKTFFGFPEGWGFSELATGDFTGESLRVGRPTYRLQHSTGDIIAVIKAPPKHKDTLDGVIYDINSTDEETYVRYENIIGDSTEMSINVYRDWSIGLGLEVNVGDPSATHVTNSIIGTYGAHFENTTSAYEETKFGSDANASYDDIVIYSLKDLEIWEYPVFSDNGKTPKNHIILTWPVPTATNTGTLDFWTPGNTICNFWYAPEHQLNNVWSYARDKDQLIPMETELEVVPRTVGPDPSHFYYEWGTYTETKRISDIHFGVDVNSEVQIGGERTTVGVEYGIEAIAGLSISASTDVVLPYVKCTAESMYASGVLRTTKVSGSIDTAVHVYFNGIESGKGYSYGVTSYLYWAEAGHLVLDYITEPTDTGFWNKYNLPDPAFILPWREADCPGKDLFSKDILINPPYANIGDTVEITATVHNFSPKPSAGNIDVTVRFCQGNPSYGCNQIGEDTVQLDHRGRADANISWEVSGSGMQEIYALIDPENDIAEMHDEITNPENNNNVSFGILQVGSSDYLDPGGLIHYDYQYITYTDTQGLAVDFYLPNAAMTETARVEFVPLPTMQVGGNTITRHGFELKAYKGGGDRDQPWHMEFSPMPGAAWLNYSDEDVDGLDEDSLILYTYNVDTRMWEDAACGEYLRYPEENWMLVPVCKTGKFALLGQGSLAYLPLINR